MSSNPVNHACLLFVAGMVGCSALQTPTTEISTTSPTTQSVSVVYRVEAAHSSRESTEANGDASKSKRAYVLSLKYPHSKCKPGYARVELVVESAKAANANGESFSRRFSNTLESVLPGVRMGEGIDEAWTMDIRYKELEQLIGQLEQQEFFINSQPTPEGAAMLAAEIGGTTTARCWRSVPELDQMVRRVRDNGKLVAHTGQAIDVAALIARCSATNGNASMNQSFATPVSYAEPIERLPPVAR